MKAIWKRNTILITALAMMIAVAGYLHFSKDDRKKSVSGKAEGEVTTYDITSEEVSALYPLPDVGEEIMSLDDDGIITGNYITENGEFLPQNEYVTEEEPGILGAVEGSENTGDEYILDTVPGTTVMANSGIVNSFSGAKLLKEQTRAKNKELLLEIINNTNIDEERKDSAIAEMIELTDISEKETSAEILLDAKGFGDSVVSISEDSVDVFVFAVELTDAQRAQIEDIVKRKTDIPADRIVITAVNE